MGISFSNHVHADNILLVSSDVNLLQEEKKFLSSKLKRMSLVIRIEIHREKNKRGIRCVAWAC